MQMLKRSASLPILKAKCDITPRAHFKNANQLTPAAKFFRE
jgi:hypothetical protein